MVQFLFFTDYPGSFTAFTSSVDLPVDTIKKIISNQSQIVLLRLTSSEIAVAPRKNLKLKESFHLFHSLMKAFQKQMIRKEKPSPVSISTWINTMADVKKAPTGISNLLVLPAKH